MPSRAPENYEKQWKMWRNENVILVWLLKFMFTGLQAVNVVKAVQLSSSWICTDCKIVILSNKRIEILQNYIHIIKFVISEFSES